MSNLERGIEIERKYIIEIPDVALMKEMENYRKYSIVQTYLESEDGATHRVRSRSQDGDVRYFETKKTRIDSMSVIEDEGEITPDRYRELLARTLEGSTPIRKTRHVFDYLDRVFEVDIYPEWERTCILEVELPSRETEIVFPPFIKIVKDVTGIKAYSNASMSVMFPAEEHL